jgi:hypothetical protein
MSELQDNRQRANSALANYSILEASSICQSNSIIPPRPHIPLADNSAFVKRRSNSTLDSYFREKFGSNAEDVIFVLFRRKQYKKN